MTPEFMQRTIIMVCCIVIACMSVAILHELREINKDIGRPVVTEEAR